MKMVNEQDTHHLKSKHNITSSEYKINVEKKMKDFHKGKTIYHFNICPGGGCSTLVFLLVS